MVDAPKPLPADIFEHYPAVPIDELPKQLASEVRPGEVVTLIAQAVKNHIIKPDRSPQDELGPDFIAD